MPEVGKAVRELLVHDAGRKERIMRELVEPNARRILSCTVSSPKSVSEIAEELQMPPRSAYRHVQGLCESGLLTTERAVLIDTGGKYASYRSLVKSVTLVYSGSGDGVDIDLTPNDSILDRFLWFWTYLGGRK